MNVYPPLSSLDEDQFGMLTSQESHTLKGQFLKMVLIERFIEQRRQEKIIQLENKFMGDGLTEEQAEKKAEKQMQLRIQKMAVDKHRYNLIVGKGSGREARYTIMIPAHIDTVKPADPSLLELRTDSRYPDRKRGLGVWDMGAAVLNNIALAVETMVPEGMQVYFVFTVDEEEDSAGAFKLIKQWSEWKYVDLVLSSEIGPLSVVPRDEDTAMRYILARRGRLKMEGSISLEKDVQAHGALDGAANACEAYSDWSYYARRAFRKGLSSKPPLQREHPLLGKEQISLGSVVSDKPEGYFNPNRVDFQYFIQLVPPGTLDSSLEAQKKVFENLSNLANWAKDGIRYTLGYLSTETSYDPYSMPVDAHGKPLLHPAVKVVQDVLRSVSGIEPVPAGAVSVADETLYAAAMLKELPGNTFQNTNKGVITIPIVGNRAHNRKEWVSWSDTARVRHAIKMLIEDLIGFRQILKK